MAAGIVAVLVALLPSPEPDRSEELQPGEAQVYEPPKPIRLTPRMRREVDATVDEFVRAAVLRGDLARSWELAASDLRVGSSRSEWMRGELPVYPYPADPKRTAWELDYADEVEVALNVTLVPRKGEREPPEVFGVSLEPSRSRLQPPRRPSNRARRQRRSRKRSAARARARSTGSGGSCLPASSR